MKNNISSFSAIKVRHLCTITGLPYYKVINCITGVYDSWTEQEKTKLFNALQEEVTKSCAVLGFTYEGRRIKPKD